MVFHFNHVLMSFSLMRFCTLPSSDCTNISFFRLGAVMCMGVTAGAYILSLFAVSSIHFFATMFKNVSISVH